jgi:hypothetical protein
MMAKARSLTTSVLIASLAAGPLFFGGIVLGVLYKTLPAPIDIRPEGVIGFVMGMLVASGIGFFVALAATVLGTKLMIALGNQFEVARHRLIWVIVGTFLGTAICFLIDPSWDAPEIGIAFILAAAICAWICRTSQPWEAL